MQNTLVRIFKYLMFWSKVLIYLNYFKDTSSKIEIELFFSFFHKF